MSDQKTSYRKQGVRTYYKEWVPASPLCLFGRVPLGLVTCGSRMKACEDRVYKPTAWPPPSPQERQGIGLGCNSGRRGYTPRSTRCSIMRLAKDGVSCIPSSQLLAHVATTIKHTMETLGTTGTGPGHSMSGSIWHARADDWTFNVGTSASAA